MFKKWKKMKIKLDKTRVGVMFFSLIFALLIKLILDNIIHGNFPIPNWILFLVSPILALLLAQKFNEGKTDGREILVFAVIVTLANFLLNWLLPSINELNLLNLSMTTMLGVTSALIAYMIDIPISVLISDIITDK